MSEFGSVTPEQLWIANSSIDLPSPDLVEKLLNPSMVLYVPEHVSNSLTPVITKPLLKKFAYERFTRTSMGQQVGRVLLKESTIALTDPSYYCVDIYKNTHIRAATAPGLSEKIKAKQIFIAGLGEEGAEFFNSYWRAMLGL